MWAPRRAATDMSLWDWASAVYARPGVTEACLTLQDKHGQSVAYLLWAAWARTTDPTRLASAARSARAWEASTVALLRAARRNLSVRSPPVGDAGREALREQVRGVELAAERLILETLEARTVQGRQRASVLESLRGATGAWGGEAPDHMLRELAAALDPDLPSGGDGRHDWASDRTAKTPMDDEDDEKERELRARLAVLSQEHADIDVAIQALANSALPDMMVIGRLKRKKLALKDEISSLQDQLTPDIIA